DSTDLYLNLWNLRNLRMVDSLLRTRVFLEELHGQRRRIGVVFMSAGVDEGHERRASFRGVELALLAPHPRLLLAAVDLLHRLDHAFLPLELDERVLFAGEVQAG